MSDFETGGDKLKENLDKMDKHLFFVFSKPYMDFIGKGGIFSFIYFVMAGVNLILPFAIIYKTIDSGVFRYVGAKFIFAIILSWLVILFAGWIGFQIWWIRRAKVVETASSEFIATTIFSEILQTYGEWLGTLTGIIGAGVGIIALLFLGKEAGQLFAYTGLDFLNFGPMVILIGPVIGFFIIILFRFIAEQIRLFASLVNHTKEIAANLRNKANGA
ncbi:MAG: hypothetical protein LBD07_03010 [Spirochaetaceae bacterium]|jgi:hypothetical protein|nr:hypothetical protein [Spirochaetaceae bacterium]